MVTVTMRAGGRTEAFDSCWWETCRSAGLAREFFGVERPVLLCEYHHAYVHRSFQDEVPIYIKPRALESRVTVFSEAICAPPNSTQIGPLRRAVGARRDRASLS